MSSHFPNKSPLYKNSNILLKSGTSNISNDLSVVLEESSIREAHSEYFNNTITLKDSLKDDTDNKYDRIIDILQFADFKYNKKSRKHFRTCRFCVILKPKNVHHCRICKTCVRRSDHHCFFINNCVGIGNYKFFIQFVFYGITILGFFSVTMLSCLNFILLEFGIDSIEFIFVSSIITATFIICITLCYLLYIHLKLISKGITTIQYLEEYKKKINKIDSKKWSQNLKKILGSSILSWLLPIKVSHETKYEGYNDK